MTLPHLMKNRNSIGAPRAASDVEEWRPIPGYERRYEVSSLGRVRSLPRVEQCANGSRIVRGGLLKPMLNTDGYAYVCLRKDGRRWMARIHRLVAEIFVPGKNALHREAAHLNGDRADARAANLKWASPRENTSHKRLHGTHQIGENHPRAKLNEAAVLEIRSIRGARVVLARKYGVTVHAIDDVRRGKNWKSLRPTGAGELQ